MKVWRVTYLNSLAINVNVELVIELLGCPEDYSVRL